MRSFINNLITNSGPALEPDPVIENIWKDAASDVDLDTAIQDVMQPKFAAESAETFLVNTLEKLDVNIADYAKQIADLTALMESAKLAHKAFSAALSTIDTANKLKIASMPKAVDDNTFTGVTG